MRFVEENGNQIELEQRRTSIESFRNFQTMRASVRLYRNWVVFWNSHHLAVFNAGGKCDRVLTKEDPELYDNMAGLPKSILQIVTDIVTRIWEYTGRAHIDRDVSGLSTRTFGIELEMLYPSRWGSREQFCRKITELGIVCAFEGYNHSDHTTGWKGVTDGSLRSEEGFVTIEIVSPILKGRDGLLEINKLCQILDDLGCKVNKSCGFHVHHGIRDLSIRRRLSIFDFYRRNERLFDSIMAPSRRGSDNSYCLSLTRYSSDVFPTTRYTKVNNEAFGRHGTIEFRQHQGTINYSKIANWVKLTQKIVEVPSTKTFNELRPMLVELEAEDLVPFFEGRVRDLA